MRIITKKRLKQFWQRHADAKQSLYTWYSEAKKANWTTPNHIKKMYPSASFLPNNKVVFNIKGNRYRLIVAMKYKFHAIYIRFIGTHDQYNKIDAKNI